VFAEVMQSYFQNIAKEFHPELFTKLCSENNNDFEMLANKFYAETKLLHQDWVNDFLQNTDKNLDLFSNDLVVVFYKSIYKFYSDNVFPKLRELNSTLNLKQRLYMRAQLEMPQEKILYPDANSTLRVSYGKVEGFSPVDGIIYKHYSTIDGIIEKSKKDDVDDYKIPARLEELYTTKNFGEYTNEKGELPVAFLASNHTTGGNSGSPILNGNGNLLGLNFDRCWESTMSDVMFDPDYCRNISVDIRYVLFVIDKLSDAKRLIEELEIIK